MGLEKTEMEGGVWVIQAHTRPPTHSHTHTAHYRSCRLLPACMSQGWSRHCGKPTRRALSERGAGKLNHANSHRVKATTPLSDEGVPFVTAWTDDRAA